MRLLDAISLGRSAPIRSNDGGMLPGAERFADAIQKCPIRYVLSDDLAQCATQLAYADGDRLSACLDLIKIPAQSLWVEWSDVPRQTALTQIQSLHIAHTRGARRAGVLVQAMPGFRTSTMRTFWLTAEELAYVSPMVTTIDLDDPIGMASRPGVPWRGSARIQLPQEPALDEVLRHIRFELEEEWADYYRNRCDSASLLDEIIRKNLECCAHDGPMLLAFVLLLNARNLLPQRNVDQRKLNKARARAGRSPLLEHVEVRAPLDAPMRVLPSGARSSRASPRLHHVRGHIARLGNTVFWRAPHLRGSARLGCVRTRTVSMTFN